MQRFYCLLFLLLTHVLPFQSISCILKAPHSPPTSKMGLSRDRSAPWLFSNKSKLTTPYYLGEYMPMSTCTSLVLRNLWTGGFALQSLSITVLPLHQRTFKQGDLDPPSRLDGIRLQPACCNSLFSLRWGHANVRYLKTNRGT